MTDKTSNDDNQITAEQFMKIADDIGQILISNKFTAELAIKMGSCIIYNSISSVPISKSKKLDILNNTIGMLIKAFADEESIKDEKA